MHPQPEKASVGRGPNPRNPETEQIRACQKLAPEAWARPRSTKSTRVREPRTPLANVPPAARETGVAGLPSRAKGANARRGRKLRTGVAGTADGAHWNPVDTAEKPAGLALAKGALFPSAALSARARDEALKKPSGGEPRDDISSLVLSLTPMGVPRPRARTAASASKLAVEALAAPAGETAVAIAVAGGQRHEERHVFFIF